MIGSSLCWNEEFQVVADEFLNLDTFEKSTVTPVHKEAKDGREKVVLVADVVVLNVPPIIDSYP